MEHGHAETAPGPIGIDELASFISDIPETEPSEDEAGTTADPGPDEDTPEEADDQADDLEGDEPDEDVKTEPPPDRKIKVTVKGDDGTDTEQEVSEDELIKSYHRQSDYTRKMQALSEREGQAVQFLKSKHDEVANQYIEKAELTRQAIVQLAGLKTESEMAQLAQSDPAAWVQENQRQQSIGNYLNNLDQQIKGERQRQAQESQARRQQTIEQMTQTAWTELAKEKIDKPALAAIYGEVHKAYGFSSEELGNVYDHRLVKMMRDATAFRALKAKAPEVTRKVQAAPPMPSKQATPAAERKQQALNTRFKSGRARLNDLAAYLNS